jgi:lipopolysaccharide export system protein LptA
MSKFITIFALVATVALVPKVFGEETGTTAAVMSPTISVSTATVTLIATNEPTTVEAKWSQVDYAQKIWTFVGNVRVVDPKIIMRADKMIVHFGQGGTNTTSSIQKIIAEGGVEIAQENKKSKSDHAEYTAADGKVVLTGNPQVQSPDGVVTGEKVTFWRGQSKMDVESSSTNAAPTRLIIYPDEMKHKEQSPSEQSK